MAQFHLGSRDRSPHPFPHSFLNGKEHRNLSDRLLKLRYRLAFCLYGLYGNLHAGRKIKQLDLGDVDAGDYLFLRLRRCLSGSLLSSP